MEAPDTIMVLAGGFKRGKDGVWRSSDFEGSDCGSPAAHIRVLAARYFYEEDPRRRILVCGGRGQCDSLLESGVTLSKIMKQELMEFGIPESSIIEDSLSNNTFQHLQHVMPLVRQYGFSKLMIVSSASHLLRVEAFLQYVPVFAEVKKISTLVSAEDIIDTKDPLLAARIREAYEHEPFPEIVAKEMAGIEQIKAGVYRLG